jgi:uncharacterized protein (TIGR03437 family)
MTLQRVFSFFLLALASVAALAQSTRQRFQDWFPSPDTNIAASAVDSEGNIYVAGAVTNGAVPVTPGAFASGNVRAVCGTSPIGGIPVICPHAFVTKIDPTGTRVIWSAYLGGSSGDEARAVAVDGAGNVYVTGGTDSLDFPVTAGTVQPLPGQNRGRGFLTKLSSGGSRLLFSTYLPAGGTSLSLASDGSIYVAGTLDAPPSTFPVSPGVYSGLGNAALMKFDPGATRLIYATLLPGRSISSIAVDPKGNVVVGGAYTTVDNVTATSGAYSYNSTKDGAFIAKLDPSASRLIYRSVIGGFPIASLTQDSAGSVYFAGAPASGFPPAIGSPTSPNVFFRGVAAKLSSDGSRLVYATYLDSSGWATISQLQADAQARLFVAGGLLVPALPTSANAAQPCFPLSGTASWDSQIGFAITLDPAGSKFTYASLAFAGGSADRPKLLFSTVVLNAAGHSYFYPSDTAIFNRVDIDAPVQPGVRCVANAADYRNPGIAPGEIVAILGPSIGPEIPSAARLDSSGHVTTELGGTQVLMDGHSAPLLYVSRNQINAVAPFAIAGAERVTVQVQSGGTTLPSISVPVLAADPGIFTLDATGFGDAAVINQDGTLNNASHPASIGSIISVWLTGAGTMQPPPADGAVPRAPAAKPALPIRV